jgi:hypothetical protein
VALLALATGAGAGLPVVVVVVLVAVLVAIVFNPFGWWAGPCGLPCAYLYRAYGHKWQQQNSVTLLLSYAFLRNNIKGSTTATNGNCTTWHLQHMAPATRRPRRRRGDLYDPMETVGEMENRISSIGEI